jgi:anti-sigma factor RsiW
MNQPCELIDDYLSHALAGDDRMAFTAHLADCVKCREAIAEHERLKRLLTRAIEELDPVPPALANRIQSRWRMGRRRLLAGWASGLAAASVLAAGVVGWLRSPHPQVVPERAATVPRSPSSGAPAVAKLTFPPSARVIALPQPSANPNVTIVWVYPMAEPGPRSRPSNSKSRERTTYAP